MSFFATNLKQIREEKEFTQAEMAIFLQLTRTAYAGYELDKSTPDFKTLISISKIIDIDLETLVNIDLSLDDNNIKTLDTKGDFTEVSIYNHKSAAGNVDTAFEDTYVMETMLVPNAMGVRKGDIGLYTDGESMRPNIMAGDLLILRKVEDNIDNLTPNDVYVIGTKDKLVVKVLKKSKESPKTHVALHSFNPDFDAFDIPKKNIKYLYQLVTLIGKR
jgi:transcriptional regulator with XRE-family HTH domain